MAAPAMNWGGQGQYQINVMPQGQQIMAPAINMQQPAINQQPPMQNIHQQRVMGGNYNNFNNFNQGNMRTFF